MADDSSNRTSSKKSVTNRRGYLQGLGVAAAAGLAGCTGGGDGGSGGSGGDGGDGGGDGSDGSGTTVGNASETIEFHLLSSGDDPNTKKAFNDSLKAYGEEEGVNVNITGEFVSMGTFAQKMNTYVGAGDVPDMVFGGGNVTTFSQEMEDIGDIADANNVPDNLQIEFPDVGTFLHPTGSEPNARWYRQDIWEEAGIGEPADNWSQHEKDMETIKQMLPDNRYPSYYQVGNTPGSMQHCWYSYEVQLGLNYIERTGPNLDDVRVSLGDNKENAVKFLNFASKMYNNYSPSTQGHGWSELITSYLEEVSQQTMYPGRLWNNGMDQAPEILDVSRPALPELPDGQNHEDDFKFQIPINGLAIPSDAENREFAKGFLRWFFDTDYYHELILGVAPHLVPVDLQMLDEEPYASNEIWTDVQETAGYKDFLQEWVPKAGYPKVMGRTNPVSPYWNQITYASGIVPKMIQSVALGQAEPEAAVDTAIQELEQQTQEVVDQFTG